MLQHGRSSLASQPAPTRVLSITDHIARGRKAAGELRSLLLEAGSSCTRGVPQPRHRIVDFGQKRMLRNTLEDYMIGTSMIGGGPTLPPTLGARFEAEALRIIRSLFPASQPLCPVTTWKEETASQGPVDLAQIEGVEALQNGDRIGARRTIETCCAYRLKLDRFIAAMQAGELALAQRDAATLPFPPRGHAS